MNFDEKQARKFLIELGYSDLVFEPDGNVPPDFLINGIIAVEVRRLNEHYFGNEKTKGLSDDAVPLRNKISRLLDEFGPPINDESWFVSYHFNRPLGNWKKMKSEIQLALNNFLHSSKSNRVILKNQSIQIDVFKANGPLDCMFNLGASLDLQSGGFLLSMMKSNIDHCINEKLSKIVNYRSRYKEWWLVLVDFIGHSLSNRNRKQFRKSIDIEHTWDKVILLSPDDHTKYFVI